MQNANVYSKGLRVSSFYYPTRPAGIPVTRTTRSSPTKGRVGYTRGYGYTRRPPFSLQLCFLSD